ncbi:small G protein signaling modulator 3, partial [Homo sapiens]
VTDLVRGTLCPALKALFEHGLKKPSLLGGACHPWLFIEEAAGREVERDFASVYSRLVLCKTFRLDEDGKVLTPEELLYRAVQSVNVTHDAVHAQMDVKLRSLICVGLNEQVLHLWLEVLCSSLPTVEKWYQPWSFLRSPGWVQIKCELRVLCCFAFSLSQDWELPAKREVGGVGLVGPALMELPKPFAGWLRWEPEVLVSAVRNYPSHAQGL